MPANRNRKREIRFIQAVMLALIGINLLTTKAAAEEFIKTTASGGWIIAESAHFSVWMHGSRAEAISTAHRCEQLKCQLETEWRSAFEEGSPEWLQPCVVVIHQNQGEYSAAVRSASPRSAGCTTTTQNGGRIIFRRIDLRRDSLAWQENALPHELTHVVLADVSPTSSLPEWLNEGLATLAESEDLKARRKQVLDIACKSGRLPPLTQVTQSDLNSQVDQDLLYACRASLLAFLQQQGGLPKLSEFTKAVAVSPCDEALKAVYQYDEGLSELERRWIQSLESQFAQRTHSAR